MSGGVCPGECLPGGCLPGEVSAGVCLERSVCPEEAVCPDGDVCPEGICLPRGGVCPGGIPACTVAGPPVNRMTERCKNITLPQLPCGW